MKSLSGNLEGRPTTIYTPSPLPYSKIRLLYRGEEKNTKFHKSDLIPPLLPLLQLVRTTREGERLKGNS